MALTKELLYFQRLLYTRTLQASQAKKAEKIFVAWLMLVIFIRFLANTGFAVSTLLEGKMPVGIPLTEFNLFHLLLLWILIPSVVTGILGSKGFLASLCIQYPLSKKEIYFTGLYGILFQPIFWLLGIVSLVGLSPLLFLKMNVPWLITGLFFLCFCMSLSIFFSFLFISISNRFRFSGIFSLLFKIVLCMLLLANFSFYWGDDVVVIIFNTSFTLFSPHGHPSILSALSFLRPSTYITSPGSFFRSAGIILIFLFLSILLMYFAFLVSHKLAAPPGKRQKRKMLTGFHPAFQKIFKRECTSLLSKEIKSLLCTIDVKMSVCIILIFIVSIILTPVINQVLFGFVIAITVILHASFFFNSFGLDRKALDRYRLFPVTPTEIIAAKNKSVLFVLSIQLFPLLLINLIKSQNILLICYYCLIFMNIMIVYCLAGNITSILLAQVRRYSHFGETGDSGSGRIFFATLCWGAPLYVNNALNGDLLTGIFIYTGVFIVLLAVFLASRGKIGLLFEEQKEEMHKNLF